ncbi:hypothetical protein M670_03806 [Schinkia azotoformans MEV2011]|uniref:Uncharacterized protein n=1 Tax=Schinkia azotoformans MEV2011 TaxID=1348973 RepID=A0A072NI09_SCHAZ|nr:hypothetical protein [Schinkia azotoformans]KEF36892.1 hypothetical protein M670_03806 [Schinkia azotoformans MEV2011]MEC1697073.1 hypothetical protein [Schinkia azotoformans]MEC1717824.1 hypothetical protein [Schinkia azotoformans]MEC1726372.1 hypothetical protein [Schinkia azotoformans]MEC1739673.1 hypothetical protein [Schinkia azotoformans]
MRYVNTFVISLISFFVLDFFQVDNVFIVGTVMVLILVGVMLPLLYTVLLETDIDKIEKFLLKNKRNPNFYIVYAMANRLDKDVRDLTEKLLKKYKSPSRQAHYKIAEALYFKNFSVIRSQVEQIKNPSYQSYYQAIVLLEDGDINGANNAIEKISSKWMKNALLVEREKKLNNLLDAKSYAEKAILHSKGLQRYLLHKTYEIEFSE